MNPPDIALLVATYQRPEHLRRCLLSIALQQDVPGRMEVVVSDDGSTDETADVVSEFARRIDFPVGFTTHPHDGFRLAQTRNEGVAASSAPYLLFLDGDCVLPSDHVRIHMQRRKPNFVMAGDCCRLEQEPSARVTDAVIRSGEFRGWGSPREERRLAKLCRAGWFYRAIRHPNKPKLIGNNVGIWRRDYERVNGYDENFFGWGCEDDDLRYRLRRAGVEIQSILHHTRTYHLWHPSHETAPARWRDGMNVKYLLRTARLTRCRNGLVKRGVEDLSIRVVGEPDEPQAAARLLRERGVELPDQRGGGATNSGSGPEVEILFLPGRGGFTRRAEYRVLVALDEPSAAAPAARRADVLIGPWPRGTDSGRKAGEQKRFSLQELARALDAVA